MSIAFHGDAALKARLLDTIDGAIAAGRWIAGPTQWDAEGERGSAIGLSVRGTDAARYASLYGYPLPLVPLLDRLAEILGVAHGGHRFVRDWVARVQPGAALDQVPARLVLGMLAADEIAMSGEPLGDALVALHRSELAGFSCARADWAQLRERIVAANTGSLSRRMRARLDLCEAACWPAGKGRSILTQTMTCWLNLAELEPRGEWSDADEHSKDAVLETLWHEQAPARDAGEQVDFPALFAAYDGDLERRYRAQLDHVNRAWLRRAEALAGRCLDLLAAAGPAPARGGDAAEPSTLLNPIGVAS